MSYLDTTLVPESGYTNVNYRQVYDVIAAQLTAHPQWDFVEAVDYVSTTFTTRSHVWRNNAATSGLSKDFHVAFRFTFTTSGPVQQTVYSSYSSGNSGGFQIHLFEDYNGTTKVISRMAPASSSATFTLAADRTHPLTWALNTILPISPTPGFVGFGPLLTAFPSYRMFVGVTNHGIYLASGSGLQAYVGGFDTLLSVTNDPLPLIVASNSNQTNAQGACAASTTRHPLLTPGPMTDAFGHNFFATHDSYVGPTFGAGLATPSAGTLGDPAITGWGFFLGGPSCSRLCISTGGALTGSVRGGLRGYLKNMLGTSNAAAHSAGDTFLIDGKAYLGLGNANLGFWDTTA